MKKRKLLEKYRGFYIFLPVENKPKSWQRRLIISRSSYSGYAKIWKCLVFVNTPDRMERATLRARNLIDKHLKQDHATVNQNTAHS